MRVALISDLHISGQSDPTQAAFVRWLDALEADQLVLLGDIFHAWWSFHGTVPVDYAATCAALGRVRARGIELVVVPGNHDFALGPFFAQVLGAHVLGPHTRTFDGRQVCLAHGDEADDSVGYWIVSKLLRGRAFSALINLLGPSLGMGLLHTLAGRSRDHMGSVTPLLKAQEAWAADRIRQGIDIVVVGHLHHPGMVSIDDGTLVRLGGWGHDRTWCLLEGGVPRLMVADQ